MNKRVTPKIDPIAFENPLGRLAMDLDPHCEGAPEGVMVTLLSAFSAYSGRKVRVQTGRGTSPLAAWFVLVGHSGKGRKGATARIAMPVIKKAFVDWASENVVAGIPATGLGMMSELSEHEGNPVFVLEEEMDTFIANAKKDTKVGEKLRKAWDGETLTHKTAKADLRIEDPHIGFVGHVQPKNWGAISGSRDATGGTYNRFLAIYVEQSKRVPVFSAPDPTPDITKAAKALRKMGAYARSTDLVEVPAEVAEVFEERHRPICESLTDGNEELAEMAERALAYLIRISALYALADMRDEITVADLDSALALITYAVASVRHVLPEVGGESIAQIILAAVRRRHAEQVFAEEMGLEPVEDMAMTEVYDLPGIGRNKKAKEIMEALNQLPQIEVYTGKSNGGRPPMKLRFHEDMDTDDREPALV